MTNTLWPRALLAALLIGVIALALAACGDDDKSSSNADVVSAINIIDKAGLHDIDDSIATKQTIPATARTTALHLQTVTLLTEWPKDLKDPAKKLAETFGDLATALDGTKPDLTKAGTAAHNAHEVSHDFSHAVWDALQKEAGVQTAPEAAD